MDKLKILSEHLDCEIDEIKQGYDESTFELGNQEYVILTDEQVDKKAKDYIKESVWAFASWFLVKHTGLDEDIIIHLQDKCESANDVLPCERSPPIIVKSLLLNPPFVKSLSS